MNAPRFDLARVTESARRSVGGLGLCVAVGSVRVARGLGFVEAFTWLMRTVSTARHTIATAMAIWWLRVRIRFVEPGSERVARILARIAEWWAGASASFASRARPYAERLKQWLIDRAERAARRRADLKVRLDLLRAKRVAPMIRRVEGGLARLPHPTSLGQIRESVRPRVIAGVLLLVGLAGVAWWHSRPEHFEPATAQEIALAQSFINPPLPPPSTSGP